METEMAYIVAGTGQVYTQTAGKVRPHLYGDRISAELAEAIAQAAQGAEIEVESHWNERLQAFEWVITGATK
jgi:hypothetical protein